MINTPLKVSNLLARFEEAIKTQSMNGMLVQVSDLAVLCDYVLHLENLTDLLEEEGYTKEQISFKEGKGDE